MLKITFFVWVALVLFAGVVQAARFDLNADDRSDILIRNIKTGLFDAYVMDGPNIIGHHVLDLQKDMNWRVVGRGDFDGDGVSDVLFRHRRTHQLGIALIQQLALKQSMVLEVLLPAERVLAVADIDGDNKADVFIHNATTNQIDVLKIGQSNSRHSLIALHESFSPLVAGDITGDGQAELLVKQPGGFISVYEWEQFSLSHEFMLPSVLLTTDTSWLFPLADVDGNGLLDAGMFVSNATFGVLRLNLGGEEHWELVFDAKPELAWPWEVVASGDYNNDGIEEHLWQHELTNELKITYWRYPRLENPATGMQDIAVDNRPIDLILSPYQRLVALDDSVKAEASDKDMNGDAKADIVWRHAQSGVNWIYTLNADEVQSSLRINSVPPPWQLVGRGDANGDGNADLYWRHPISGENYLYHMQGEQVTQVKKINQVSAQQGWEVLSITDFNGDKNADLLWLNTQTGALWLYLMDGASIQSSHQLMQLNDLEWILIAANDLNGDGVNDLVWRHASTGVVWKHLLVDGGIADGGELMRAGNDWRLIAVADFDGDGGADLLWRNRVDGRNYVYFLNKGVIDWSRRGLLSQFHGDAWQVALSGDVDGDGDDDLIWRNQQNGDNYLYLMNPHGYQGYKLPAVSDLNWYIR